MHICVCFTCDYITPLRQRTSEEHGKNRFNMLYILYVYLPVRVRPQSGTSSLAISEIKMSFS